MEEDAEAKLLRLRQAAGNHRDDRQDAAAPAHQGPGQKQSKGRKARQKSAAAATQQTDGDEDWQGIVAVTEGPTSIDTNGPHTLFNGNAPAAVNGEGDVERSEQPVQNGFTGGPSPAQIILHSRAEILSPQAKQKGKSGPKALGKRKPVSIGPLPHTSAAADGDSDARVGEGEVAAPAFIRSKAFSGGKVGYSFGKGKRGLGYYMDADVKANGWPNAKRRKSVIGIEDSQAEVDGVLEDIATGGAAEVALCNHADTGTGLTFPNFINWIGKSRLY